MPSEPRSTSSQAGNARLRHDGVKQYGDQLAQRRHKPGRVRRRRPSGEILELIDKRLEQKDHQQMSQHPRSGRARVGGRRAMQANQTFQPFETKLDPPSQVVEGHHILGRPVIGLQRGDQDHPSGGNQRRRGDLVALSLRLRRAFRRAAAAAGSGFLIATIRSARGDAFLRPSQISRSIRRAWRLRSSRGRLTGVASASSQRALRQPARTTRSAPAASTVAMRSGFKYTRSARRIRP